MNIDHGVRNSIYRTGRAATLRARLTIFPFSAAHDPGAYARPLSHLGGTYWTLQQLTTQYGPK
jgi:hypothetical protein